MGIVTPTVQAHPEFLPIFPGGLPIFRKDNAEYSIFYAPGYFCLVSSRDVDQFQAALFNSPTTPPNDEMAQASAALTCQAQSAILAQQRWQTAPFAPECLTLYLHNQCNLRCVYCFAGASPYALQRLKLKAIRAAAGLVADACRDKGCPFTIVLHGGGEPTLDQDYAEQVLTLLNEIARTHALPTFRYVATNGVMSGSKARWLAQQFDLIGLSCDGTVDVQNKQRPLWSGGETAPSVERTARILQEAGRRVHVRATITPMNVERQSEIVDYFCNTFTPEEIHFEPVYSGGRSLPVATEPMAAADFVEHFLRARRKARAYGVSLVYAGCRLESAHGPYCNVFRNVLNLVPGGVATACFKLTRAHQVRKRNMVVGALDAQTGEFVIDQASVHGLRLWLSAALPQCRDCFNQYHCAAECPDTCSDSHNAGQPTSNFRCRLQRGLADAILQEYADHLWSTSTPRSTVIQAQVGSDDARPIV